MEVVTDPNTPSGDANESDSANTLLAEYVAANANLRKEREKLEKDLAAVRQAHEDLLFQRHDHTEESSDEGRALRMKLELHKNQVICRRVYRWLNPSCSLDRYATVHIIDSYANPNSCT